ncbi:MAG: PilZ domain-containing protein [Thermodesulfovibrionia bacterium]|nr:PilZ domain-containing protein [Thermodesulfovibrionia bacterium]
MERRCSERKDVKIDVKISLSGKSYAGFIDNISPEGLGATIVTAPEEDVSGFVKGTKLELSFQAKREEITLQCEIKWINISSEIHVGVIYIIGAEIIDPPAEYKELIRTL